MHTVAIANPKRAVSLLTDQDEELASRSAVRLLITVSNKEG
jgi:hypothetical protein